jgi:hypothetical protein
MSALKIASSVQTLPQLKDVTSLINTAGRPEVFITQLIDNWDCFTSHHYQINDTLDFLMGPPQAEKSPSF